MIGQWFPFQAEPDRWLWLGVSGLIGFVIGDGLLFQAFVVLGPRLSMLIFALNPVFSALLGWGFLNEYLTGQELLGIALSIGGVALVVTDNNKSSETNTDKVEPPRDMRRYMFGVLLALGGAICQSAGLFASKMGLVGDFPALSGNLIRLVTAAIVLWTVTLVQGQVRTTFTRLRENPQAMRTLTTGAIAGPFLGVWMSLIAVQYAPLGVASTLMTFAPIILLPVDKVLFNETITQRAIAGTILAIVGTALLFL